jgi:hypothetical protein
MIHRHKAGMLKEDEKSALEEETLARMIPLVLESAETLADSHSMQSSMSCLAHLLDKAPPAVLDRAFSDSQENSGRGVQSHYCELSPCSTWLCSFLQKAVSFA